jgi:CoA-binding domain
MEQRLQQPERLEQPEEKQFPCNYEGLGVGKTQRWRQAWRQRLVVATLVLSDLVLALSVWRVASLLQGEWSRGPLSAVAAASVVPVVAVWLGLRALLGLYPGYGLDSVETLRRHTYAVFATVAMLAVFALGFKTGGSLSRLLLFFFFLSLLVLAPLAQHLVKRGLKRAGLWGKPVMIFGFGQNEGRVKRTLTRLLQEEWDLGYNPVAVFNRQLPRLAPAHPTRFARPQEDSSGLQILANAADPAHRQGVDTTIFAMPHTRRE